MVLQTDFVHLKPREVVIHVLDPRASRSSYTSVLLVCFDSSYFDAKDIHSNQNYDSSPTDSAAFVWVWVSGEMGHLLFGILFKQGSFSN